MQVFGDLAGEHLDVAGAEHVGGGAEVANVLERSGLEGFVDGAFDGGGVGAVEGGEVEENGPSSLAS